MISIRQTGKFDAIPPRAEPASGSSGFGEVFSVSLADNLLKDTMQYKKWKAIRQNDPAKAIDMSRIVLERHDYVTGKIPATEDGRKHFNTITERLKNEGIHLYRSYEFRNPVFDEPDTQNETFHPVSFENASGIGRRFVNRDCFEFLAGILEDNGISYYGTNGVGNALIDQARSRGMNMNSFLTGEGVTRLLCGNPVEIRVSGKTEVAFEEIWDKIEPDLKKGSIISFSSQDSGHTGIVNRENNRWVFVNSSGTPGNRGTYRVVREDLKDEIRNRLQRAKSRQTFLDITFGSVSRDLTARFKNPLLSEANRLKEIDLFEAA